MDYGELNDSCAKSLIHNRNGRVWLGLGEINWAVRCGDPRIRFCFPICTTQVEFHDISFATSRAWCIVYFLTLAFFHDSFGSLEDNETVFKLAQIFGLHSNEKVLDDEQMILVDNSYNKKLITDPYSNEDSLRMTCIVGN